MMISSLLSSNLSSRKWKTIIPAIIFGMFTIFLLLRSYSSKQDFRLGTGARPSVEIRQGKIIGVEALQDGRPQVLEEFLGIPFAEPTGGENRFRPPIPVNASTAEFDASSYGERCPAPPRNNEKQGEDCLNLNIWRPRRRPNEKKKFPVLVHFHGGAFNSGYGHGRQISNLVAWAAEPMIGVSFNYRVGAFGFLPSKWSEKEGLLNNGLKDQVLLLEWVKENIEAFGGDPDNITIMGVSAGAHSIGHHLLRKIGEKPLFNRVIMESGGATARAIYHADFKLHEKQFEEFLTELNLHYEPKETLLASMGKLSTRIVKSASEEIWYKYDPSVRWPFQPVIDGPGGMIEVAPIEAIKAGKYHKVPILTGFNTNEGAMFTPGDLETSDNFTTFFRALLPGLTETDLKELELLYPDPIAFPDSEYVETREGFEAQFRRTEQAYGQFAYVAPVKQYAHYAAAADPASVYLYHFAVNTTIRGGADHGQHSAFSTYNDEIWGRSRSLKQISQTMHAYWTSFILTGDPNAITKVKRPIWPKFDESGESEGELAVFGEGNDEMAGGKGKGEVVKVLKSIWKAKECKFWWDRTEKFEL